MAAGQMPMEQVAQIIELAREKVTAGKCPFVWVYLVGAFRRYFEHEKRGWPWRKP